MKWMHIHHLAESENDEPENLCTLCVACHSVMHLGRNLSLGAIEIWKSPLSQVEIVRRTREGIRNGLSLADVNATFRLKRGKYPPDSVEWANKLLVEMQADARAELPTPLCAVFVEFQRWQIEA